MKFYLKNINKNSIDKILLKEYIHNSKKNKQILSEQGIVEINQDKMFLLKVLDIPCELTDINTFRGFIDRSTFIKEEIWYQIPKKHILEETDINTYQLRQNAMVEFVIVEDKNIIKDFYFNVKKGFEVFDVQNDILTFLSLLKLC